jgi:hypothetical protein
MRHLAWLFGLLLVVSCSINPVLKVDGSPSGGGGTNGGGGRGGATTGNGGAGGDHAGGGSGGAITGSGGAGGGSGGATTGSGGAGGDQASGGSGGATTGSGGGTAGAGGGTAGAGGGTAGAGGGATGAGGSIAGQSGGGQAGHSTGKDGGETCAELETDYSDALMAARKCTPGAADQCQHLVGLSISCPGCKGYVNDATTLDIIAGEWKDQGCKVSVCPAIACIAPGTGVCLSTSGGPGGTCQSGFANTN